MSSSDIQHLEIDFPTTTFGDGYRVELMIYAALRELLMEKKVRNADRYFEKQIMERWDSPRSNLPPSEILKIVMELKTLEELAKFCRKNSAKIELRRVDDATKTAILGYIDNLFDEEIRRTSLPLVPLSIFSVAPAVDQEKVAVVVMFDSTAKTKDSIVLFNHAWDAINRPSSGIAFHGYGFFNFYDKCIIDGIQEVGENQRDAIARHLEIQLNREYIVEEKFFGHLMFAMGKTAENALQSGAQNVHLVFVTSMLIASDQWKQLHNVAMQERFKKITFHIVVSSDNEIIATKDNLYVHHPHSTAAIDQILALATST